MGRLLRQATAFAYSHAAKPLLFAMPPDTVHNGLLRIGAPLSQLAPLLNLTRSMWAHSDAILHQKVCGMTFKNPIGLSAGFDKNFQLMPLMQAVGFGFMEGGSITYQPCPGNPKPWFYRLPHTESLVVHAGLANHGAHSIIPRIVAKQNSLDGFPINVSVAKTNSPQASSAQDAIADYIGTLQLIKKTGAGNMVTINISCPNTYGGEPFTTPSLLEQLLKQTDAIGLQQPVFIKMPIDPTPQKFSDLLDVIARHKVAGVTIGNLLKDRTLAHLRDPLPASVKGGLSGRPTYTKSNQLIQLTYQRYGNRFVIIGVGGVFSAQDAYTKIKLGATLVELITGMIFKGPQLIGDINAGLAQLLRRDGYTSIQQAIGVDTPK